MTDHGKGEDFLSVFWAVTGDLHGLSVQLYKTTFVWYAFDWSSVSPTWSVVILIKLFSAELIKATFKLCVAIA